MRTTKLLIPIAVTMAYCGAASAGTITDPAMGMDAGSFSTPLSQFTGFTPDQTNGGGILDLYNDTGSTITSITFQVFVKTGLSVDTISSAFPCNGATDPLLPNPFFLTCTHSYNSATGQLDFIFAGVNPTGADTGIPPAVSETTSATISAQATADPGHFAITFNDDFALTGDTGGWLGSDTALFNGPPDITVAAYTAPEPSSLSMACIGLLAISLGATGRRLRAWRSRASAPPV